LERLAENLRLLGGFNLEEAFIDGTFAPEERRCGRRQNEA
jgi:hypothetical protein